MKTIVACYSMYGHIAQAAQAAAEGEKSVSGAQGERQPSKNELDAARYQGRYAAPVAEKTAGIKIG